MEYLIFNSAAALMVKRVFYNIQDLNIEEQFITVDTEMYIFIVGAIKGVGQDNIIGRILAIHDVYLPNPLGSMEIVL
ncbi:hypothetical protein [Planococcus wigleyi]|uniref:Uncharacterized protein n=1 Tax=Planococcus wigleyi TaxID=2762216 RepID=A0ABR8W8Q4_9BACL|nr:hypothetical protein [Planococcus wigleyi]MBD8013389.1 hypothetical protein [Planococcus wigleyi]